MPLPEPFDQVLELIVEHGVARLQVGHTSLETDVLGATLFIEQPRKLYEAHLKVVEDDYRRRFEQLAGEFRRSGGRSGATRGPRPSEAPARTSPARRAS